MQPPFGSRAQCQRMALVGQSSLMAVTSCAKGLPAISDTGRRTPARLVHVWQRGVWLTRGGLFSMSTLRVLLPNLQFLRALRCVAFLRRHNVSTEAASHR